MHYLRKYVGTYRVKADYDLDTKDYPRLENGDLDPSFDDLYIVCKNDIKIRHGVGNVLSCHIPSKQRGINILKKIYTNKIFDKLPNGVPLKDDTYYKKLCTELTDKEVLVSAEVLDYEVYFEFKTNMLEYIAKLIGASNYGARIQPFSSKNLPKEPYKIPEKDLKLYKESIKGLPVKTVVINGKPREMVDGFVVKSLNKEFDDIIIASQSKKFNIDKDRKSKGLKGKEYIHSWGSDMWKRYCDYLKEAAKEQ